MSRIVKVSVVLVVLVISLLSILVVNSIRKGSEPKITLENYLLPSLTPQQRQHLQSWERYVEQLKYKPDFNNTVIQTFSQVIRFKTISYPDVSLIDFNEFEKQEQFLIRSFPNVFSKLERIPLSPHPHSKNLILLKWQGANPSLLPFLFASHLDVVPIAPNTEQLWSTDPFNGTINEEEGYIYGRGTLDDKFGIIGILTAVENLLSSPLLTSNNNNNGESPFQRTFYIAFGHDEESLGRNGAMKIVSYLKQQNLQFEYVLDEGGSIFPEGIPPLLTFPIALIATAEKGIMSLNLSIEGIGGHSSMPDSQTPIGILSKAISSLEQTQLPKSISGAFKDMLEFISPYSPFPIRLVTSNLWFFSPLLSSLPAASSTIAASMRSTLAPTIIHAGEKDNVLPKVASAIINIRILPGESSSLVIDRVRSIINDPRVQISIQHNDVNEPTPISPSSSHPFKLLQSTLSSTFPSVLASPYLALGATDGRFYYEVTENVLRFAPAFMKMSDLPRLHGVDERVLIVDVINMAEFYAKLILYSQFDHPHSSSKHEEL